MTDSETRGNIIDDLGLDEEMGKAIVHAVVEAIKDSGDFSEAIRKRTGSENMDFRKGFLAGFHFGRIIQRNESLAEKIIEFGRKLEGKKGDKQ